MSRNDDFVFIEVKADDKQGSMTRGNKISHALKRYHRAARKDRAEKHFVSRTKTHAISPAGAERGLVVAEPSARRLQQADVEKEDLELIELVKPPALEVVLGQGRLDPFNVYPTENVSTYVHEVLDHGTLPTVLLLSAC
jgi:hypothetical protein